MESMVERVARAIATYAEGSSDQWGNWKEEARAAIEAMREPSEHAMDCGAYRLPGVMQEAKQAKARDVYRAMIDAALNEQERA